jgi:hypothetical protein
MYNISFTKLYIMTLPIPRASRDKFTRAPTPLERKKEKRPGTEVLNRFLVGSEGFEPPTLCL